MEKRRVVSIGFLILAVFWAGYIWSFSLKDATASTADSNKVIEIVEEFVREVSGKEVTVSSLIVRKLAHFSGFAVLGALLFCTFHFWNAVSTLRCFALSLGSAVAVAVTDELIQIFSNGRSASVVDVIIDTSGSAVGLFAALFVFVFINKLSGRNVLR